jgi:hypothetical protein
MKKRSKADQQFIEDQNLFRQVLRAEPMRVMVALIRRTLTREALALEEYLTPLGLTLHEREAIYKELNKRREALEAELHLPGAYDRLIAEASVLGLLTPPEVSLETSGKEANP